jgi:TolB protein
VSSETANGIDRQTGAGPRARIWRFRLFLLLAVLLTASMAWAANWASDNYGPGALDPTLVALATEIHNTASPTSTEPTASPSPTLPPAATRPSLYGTLFFAMRSGGHSHLWAYVPGDSSPIPLTTGDWDDRDPAVSPDGESLAFASDRDGPWDLYLLDLTTLAVTRLTSTPGFEGHPTWSPDGIWLAYEADYDGDLDIWILPVDGVGDAIQLTTQPGADQTPSWDPNGRRIAFATDRDGGMDIYLADLDSVDDRFRNLTHSPDAFDTEPAFHPAGTTIAFSSERDGVRRILALDPAAPSPASGEVGQGVSPAWSPDGLSLAAILLSPIDRYVAMYAVSSEGLPSLGVSITGAVSSLIWSPVGLPGEAASMGRSLPTPQPLYLIETVEPAPGSGRMRLTHVPDLSAPIEELSDAVDEAFIALRQRAAQDAGWDFLSSLEHAFVGLNDPLPPGFLWNDWLYTGRAFAFNPAVFDAGWVEVVREDIGGQTYWRVFVRANPQDGSLGEPLRQAPWDFQARYLGDPLSYDEGGALKPSIPSGYYIDFTTLAQDFAFERMPALPNWRTFYPAVRYNEFALTDGLDWMSAMLELYPPSAVITPTPYRTPTPTPSRTPRPTATPWWIIWRTPTSPPTATETPTPTQMQVP